MVREVDHDGVCGTATRRPTWRDEDLHCDASCFPCPLYASPLSTLKLTLLSSHSIGMSACLVQLWYSFALYKCCTSTRLNRIVVAILVAIPPVAMFILGCILFARMYHTKSFIDLPSQRTISLACIAANLSVDFYLTASLVFFLMIKPSRESGGIFRSSSCVPFRLCTPCAPVSLTSSRCRQIKNLVVAVLRTNFLATSAQATALALVVARPHGTEFCVVSGMIPKMSVSRFPPSLFPPY